LLTKLEHLENLAYKRDIHIHNFTFSKTKKAACYHELDGVSEYKAILLDKPNIQNDIEKILLFAEEIGHFETHSLYLIEATANSPIARSNRLKHEAKAKRWAIKYLIPKNEIQRAFDNHCKTDCEVAEYCDVDLDTLYKAIEIYQQENVKFDFPLEA